MEPPTHPGIAARSHPEYLSRGANLNSVILVHREDYFGFFLLSLSRCDLRLQSEPLSGLVQVAQSQGNTFFDGRRRCSGRK